MPMMTIVWGVFMIALGVIGYFATGRVSVTALIPAFVGVPVLLCGWLATKEKLRMHAMHVAVLLMLLSAGGSARGTIKLIKNGTDIERVEAAIAQTIMFGLALIYIVFAVRSFIAARRNRQSDS